ncbi:response regulator [Bacillus benzoevorans]|uniref:Two-component SAPR family response regulator n=1 Tax=Bacillus benzoevorans TaxID=1456 RepID=A0A7X0HNB4_9BACI|nr:response regulator [Bacillus benzoevorans]MBB6443962.1 two-component SAPR family response regulator [Bacillus benzoevorans]
MIRTIIVDDEEFSLLSLENKLKEFPDICIVHTYTKQEKILSDLKREKVDVAFLDIEMGELNGLDFAEAILSIQSSIHIVFVTAHSEYAVKAFEINSIDYLLKPVTKRRLQKTINRLKEKIGEIKDPPTQESPDNTLKIRCFHELQAFQNEQPIHFKTAKVKELFGFLLTHMHEYINRDVLIESLWPDQDYKKSKINLHTCLSHLRKILNGLGYSNCITFSNQCYSMTLENIDCDAFEVERIFQHIDTLDETNILEIENAIGLYTGAYMELNGYEWAYESSQKYHEKVSALLNRAIAFHQNIDDNKTLHFLQLQLKMNPYDDEMMKQCMEILIHQGNRSEAIILFERYKERLTEDLGIEPDISLTRIYHSLF